jgi:lysophospholipase L1-like esterase
MKISDIDSNLRVAETLELPDVQWFGAGSDIFRVYGTSGDCGSGPFRRVPEDVAAATSEAVAYLATNTAGIRLRLRTDSPYVAIHAEWHCQCQFPHMAVTGVSGFDLYRISGGASGNGVQEFAGTFIPPFISPHGYESVLPTPGGMQDLVIYFPLYNDVSKLYVGLQAGAKTEAPGTYSYKLPVAFYGSSITQGGCASRPGTAYQAMLSRALDVDIVNLGFSGSALGETAIVRYIASLPLLAFVCDYDHNAPTPEHLERTHYPLYKTVREAQPDLPILFLSKPDGRNINPDAVNINLRRAAIIRETYDRAVREGDNNVYYINGFSLYEEDVTMAASVDGCHPNDLGFYFFFKALLPVLKSLLGGKVGA